MRAGPVSLLFPPKCASCGVLLRFEGFGQAELPALCPKCRKLWDSEKLTTCGECGEPVSLCGCMTEELQKARCKGFYKLVYYLHGKNSAVQNRMLFRIKNSPARRCTDFLAQEMAERLRPLTADGVILPVRTVIVYIPRGHSAALQTGTDQAKRLASAFSELTGIPVSHAVARRWGKKKPQKKLDRNERRRNAKRSYRLRKNISLNGKDVILIDDIVTTGSSMAATAKLLRGAGAENIYCFAVASDDCNQNIRTRQPTFKIDRSVR